MNRRRRSRRASSLLLLVPLLAAQLAGCASPRLAYYPAVPPDPLADDQGRRLTGLVVRDGAEVLAAPRAGAERLDRLAFGDKVLLYAYQPGRGRHDNGASRFALVGSADSPGVVSGWVPSVELLPSDARPDTLLVVRAGQDTALRSGPGGSYPVTGSAEHWFLAVSYARRGGYLLTGPLQQTRGASEAPEVGGWLPRTATSQWDGAFGVQFFKDNFHQRIPARVARSAAQLLAAETGEIEVLYAEPASPASLPPGAHRFPVLGWPADAPRRLQIALPGGTVGWVAEFDAAGQRQVVVERLMSRFQVAGARQLFRRVTDRARNEPRALAGAVEAATGSPTTSLADHCVATLDLPLHTPLLERSAEALTAACLRDPGSCAAAVDALRRSADALDSVEEEIAVRWIDGEAVPVREHSWSKGPRPRPYWWRGGDGREMAWVPLEFLP